jgi:hypothetical protein
VGIHQQDYTVSQPRRSQSNRSLPWKSKTDVAFVSSFKLRFLNWTCYGLQVQWWGSLTRQRSWPTLRYYHSICTKWRHYKWNSRNGGLFTKQELNPQRSQYQRGVLTTAWVTTICHIFPWTGWVDSGCSASAKLYHISDSSSFCLSHTLVVSVHAVLSIYKDSNFVTSRLFDMQSLRDNLRQSWSVLQLIVILMFFWPCIIV